jgi:hypothetical protein
LNSKPNIEPSSDKKLKEILNWSKEDVNKWLNEKEICTGLRNLVFKCDGKLLHELYLIKLESPDFFFKSLKTKNLMLNNSITLRDVAHFSSEIKILFS